MARNAPTAPYVPKKITVKLPEEEKKDGGAQPEATAIAAPDDDEVVDKLIEKLSGLAISVNKSTV